MAKALISPSESVLTGYRVAQIDGKGFEVADPLFWVQCDAGIDPAAVWFDPFTESILPLPVDNTAEVDFGPDDSIELSFNK